MTEAELVAALAALGLALAVALDLAGALVAALERAVGVLADLRTQSARPAMVAADRAPYDQAEP